jgi:hypothetical protein
MGSASEEVLQAIAKITTEMAAVDLEAQEDMRKRMGSRRSRKSLEAEAELRTTLGLQHQGTDNESTMMPMLASNDDYIKSLYRSATCKAKEEKNREDEIQSCSASLIQGKWRDKMKKHAQTAKERVARRKATLDYTRDLKNTIASSIKLPVFKKLERKRMTAPAASLAQFDNAN